MDESQWLASVAPAAMLKFAHQRDGYWTGERTLTDRQLRLFAAACTPFDDSWARWADQGGAAPGEFSAHDGARYWVGIKVGQCHQMELRLPQRTQRANLLREIVGNPFRPVAVDPDWLTWGDGTVRRLAEAIYRGRDWGRLPILADALEEAGCDNEDLLRHLRGWEPCVMRPRGLPDYVSGWSKLRGPHVRGCWAVDLLRGVDHATDLDGVSLLSGAGPGR